MATRSFELGDEVQFHVIHTDESGNTYLNTLRSELPLKVNFGEYFHPAINGIISMKPELGEAFCLKGSMPKKGEENGESVPCSYICILVIQVKQTTNFAMLQRIEEVRSEGLKQKDECLQDTYMGSELMKLRGGFVVEFGTELDQM